MTTKSAEIVSTRSDIHSPFFRWLSEWRTAHSLWGPALTFIWKNEGLILASTAVAFCYYCILSCILALLQSHSDSKCSQRCLKVTGWHMKTRDCAQDVELTLQGYVCHLKFRAFFQPACFRFLIRTWGEGRNHCNVIITTLIGIKCCAATELFTQESQPSPRIPLKLVSCIS